MDDVIEYPGTIQSTQWAYDIYYGLNLADMVPSVALVQWSLFLTFGLPFLCKVPPPVDHVVSWMSERRWTSEDFPNPRNERDRCGHPAVNSAFVCDPSGYLSDKEGIVME